ncbi:CoA pyrophosphatase [Proteiniborus sp. MB09-C3]|uniref:NUDIX hydrolase n=1 Tax=Proteiniborus sp. MB09-C3 TaxID=3050072 RepID=UPI0025522CD5|nr:CoA pyrophosphatase [Proteiniborus sp. MB09-C3]WIV13011.1 CoA pyrophosphatase [Proteiniborus sp. MB09-C3]
MDIFYVEQMFKERKGKPLELENNYAVLLPLINIDGKWNVLFEVRSEKLDRQPNEISFPGGKIEEKETFREGAIRETCEELNIEPDNIALLGELDYIVSVNSAIYGFVGILENLDVDYIQYSENEVDHVFTVPLDFFLNNEPETHYTRLEVTPNENFPYHLIQNGRGYNWNKGSQAVHFYVYGDYVIWGMTARFIKNFVNIVKKDIK